jgi:hypothetical protein
VTALRPNISQADRDALDDLGVIDNHRTGTGEHAQHAEVVTPS